MSIFENDFQFQSVVIILLKMIFNITFGDEMYICVCKGIRERQVHEVVAKGAKTWREASAACGAATDCGSCVKRLQRIFNKARNGVTK